VGLHPCLEELRIVPGSHSTNTYLNSSGYTSAYIYNRLVSSTVTDGTNTAYVASNSYDGSALNNVTGMTQHDSAYSTSLVYRGNPTTIGTLTSTVTQVFDIGGGWRGRCARRLRGPPRTRRFASSKTD
jgi:hypothetical protein